MRFQNKNRRSKIAIVGGGPAGSSLAIRLAERGFEVTLVEREKFPRHKLCGEFISPECLRHFAELGVLDAMLSAGGERIFETRFYDQAGRSFSVPSNVFDDRGFALSLSRSEMDRILLQAARSAGVEVLEGAKISDVTVNDGSVISLKAAGESDENKFISADLFIDATGRSAALAKLVERKLSPQTPRPNRSIAVGYKNHFRGISVTPGTCEIFAFPGGYGGLTAVEDGMVNLCFLIDSQAARKTGNADDLVAGVLSRNKVAARLMKDAVPVRDWLAVSIGSFGQAPQPSAINLLTVGDASAFIDPFTGSGMLMALESSALLAETVRSETSPEVLRERYRHDYDRLFSRRLQVCSLLRRAAHLPMFPTLAVSFLNLSKRSRNFLAGSTRSARRPSQETT